MIKIIPILLGVLGSYVFALIVDPAARAHVVETVSEAAWIGLPIHWRAHRVLPVLRCRLRQRSRS